MAQKEKSRPALVKARGDFSEQLRGDCCTGADWTPKKSVGGPCFVKVWANTPSLKTPRSVRYGGAYVSRRFPAPEVERQYEFNCCFDENQRDDKNKF
jgi:hypothetical protein